MNLGQVKIRRPQVTISYGKTFYESLIMVLLTKETLTMQHIRIYQVHVIYFKYEVLLTNLVIFYFYNIVINKLIKNIKCNIKNINKIICCKI